MPHTLASPLFHKTQICNFFKLGKCTRAGACRFAHSPEELRPTPDLRFTKMCREWCKTGVCKKGGACAYAHSEQELQARARAPAATTPPASGQAAGEEGPSQPQQGSAPTAHVNAEGPLSSQWQAGEKWPVVLLVPVAAPGVPAAWMQRPPAPVPARCGDLGAGAAFRSEDPKSAPRAAAAGSAPGSAGLSEEAPKGGPGCAGRHVPGSTSRFEKASEGTPGASEWSAPGSTSPFVMGAPGSAAGNAASKFEDHLVLDLPGSSWSRRPTDEGPAESSVEFGSESSRTETLESIPDLVEEDAGVHAARHAARHVLALPGVAAARDIGYVVKRTFIELADEEPPQAPIRRTKSAGSLLSLVV